MPSLNDHIVSSLLTSRPKHHFKKLSFEICVAVTDVSVSQIAEYCSDSLIDLQVYGCRSVTLASISTVLRNCKLLHTLDVQYCTLITNRLWREILFHAPQLKSLNVTGCDRLSSEGASEFAKLRVMESFICDKKMNFEL
jgi:hypothetical protein